MTQNQIQITVNPPPAEGLPWLVVALSGETILHAFACEIEAETEQVVVELEARFEGRGVPVAA